MSKDLFAALSVKNISNTMFELESRINLLFSRRHDYPIWPTHNGQPDEFEEMLHGPLRHVYYHSVIMLVHTLQELRKLT